MCPTREPSVERADFFDGFDNFHRDIPADTFSNRILIHAGRDAAVVERKRFVTLMHFKAVATNMEKENPELFISLKKAFESLQPASFCDERFL